MFGLDEKWQELKSDYERDVRTKAIEAAENRLRLAQLERADMADEDFEALVREEYERIHSGRKTTLAAGVAAMFGFGIG
jgi:hypothetical protein